ncbi:MAG: hypothetical protein HY866_04385 [Chloroflexi bacterium]|nr:hypothetical protein [Chloroflexota bacterium]
MDLNELLDSVTYVRDEEEHIIAVEVPIEMWRVLLDQIQQMEEREKARQNLARLRRSHETGGAPDQP